MSYNFNNQSNMANKDNLDDIKNDLLEVLDEATEGSTTFAVGSYVSKATNPGLFVDDHGMIGLPLSDHDVKAIISLAKQSPFGHREQTLVDTSVRKSWELEPSQFRLRNPEWDRQLESIVTAVYEELRLSCGRDNIGAELYKLLLYEEGAFFKPHKDSEKAPGMFGTLVISLPSLHEGGIIQLKHDGKTLDFDFSDRSQFETSFAAWYADITHEVLPVKSGRRMVLIYNLIRKNTSAEIPSPRDSQGQQSRLQTILDTYNAGLHHHHDWPAFLVHILAHKYTQAHLSFDSLKGEDYETVQCLKNICAESGFELYLSIFEREVLMDPDGCDEIHSQHRLNHIIDISGQQVNESVDLPRAEGNLLVELSTLEGDADESVHEGWTGNEGATATYWYRDASIVIVPRFSKIKTMYNIENKPASLRRMRMLVAKAATDLDSREQLFQLCKLVLPEFPTAGVSFYGIKKIAEVKAMFKPSEIFTLALTTILKYDEVDILNSCVTTANLEFLRDHAHDLGCTTARVGLDLMKPKLLSVVRDTPDASAKYEFLNSVYEAFVKVSPDREQSIQEFRTWRDTQLIQEYTTSTLGRKDGISLAKLCVNLSQSSIETLVWPIVMKSGIATRVTFLNTFSSKQPTKLSSNDMKLKRKLITEIWDDFKFPGQATEPRNLAVPSHMTIYYQSQAPKADISQMLESSDVPQLLNSDIALTNEEGQDFHSDASTRKIVNAIKSAPQEAIEITIIPFIKDILSKASQVESKEPSMDNKSIVSNALHQYVLKCVGKEPKAPTSWVMSPRTCTCNDCKIVNRFLVDPWQTVLDFPCGSGRRAHLHRTFGDRSGSWSIKTLHIGNPHVWQMTKNRTDYDTAHAAWKTRFEQAKRLFKDMGGVQVLKEYLGRDCRAILSADAIILPSELRQPLTEINQNQSDPNRESDPISLTPRRGTKRSLDSVNVENISEKRLRADDHDEQQRTLQGKEQVDLGRSTFTNERGQNIEIIEID